MFVTSPTRSPFSAWRAFDRSFERSFDRMFAQLANLTDSRPAWTFAPELTGAWTDDGYQLTVDLPGVAEDAIGVSVTGRTLTIDVAAESGDGAETVAWTRSLRLPQTLDPEQVTARYVHGRLTVTVGRTPQPPAPEPRRIAIETTPPAKALEASSGGEVAADAEPQPEKGEDTSVTG